MHQRTAFTLVELMVVITIIVVMLALLAPALEKAIYQAELASCGANQRVILGALTTYAMENKRRYPIPIAHGPAGYSNPEYLNYPGADPPPQRNIRDGIGRYLPAKAFVCPAAPRPSDRLDREYNNPTAGAELLGSYFLLWGYQQFAMSIDPPPFDPSDSMSGGRSGLLTQDCMDWEVTEMWGAHPGKDAAPVSYATAEGLYAFRGDRFNIQPDIPVNAGYKDGGVRRYESAKLIRYTLDFIPQGVDFYLAPLN